MTDEKRDERTIVPVMRRDQIPTSLLPSVHLLDQLAEIFPDEVIDIPEVSSEEDEDAESV
jgi:hypothetical protein